MPNPTRENVHVNRPLTNIAINYIQDQDRFVADQAFPYVGVQKKSDDYFKFSKADLSRVEAKKRADGAESAGSGYRLSTGTYNADTYAFHKDVGDQTRANSDNPLQPDRNATEFVMQNLLMKREIIFGNKFLNQGHANYVGWDNEDSTADWSPDGDNPIRDISKAMDTVADLWIEPNVAIMGRKVFRRLEINSNVVDRYKHTTPNVDTSTLLADVLSLDEVYVSRALYNTAEEGASASMSRCIPNDSMLLVHAPTSPSLDIPSAGYTFGWEGLEGADGLNVRMKQFRMEENASDRIEGEMAFDMKQTSSALGYLFHSITLD